MNDEHDEEEWAREAREIASKALQKFREGDKECPKGYALNRWTGEPCRFEHYEIHRKRSDPPE